jgi:hypothetical protein
VTRDLRINTEDFEDLSLDGYPDLNQSQTSNPYPESKPQTLANFGIGNIRKKRLPIPIGKVPGSAPIILILDLNLPSPSLASAEKGYFLIHPSLNSKL